MLTNWDQKRPNKTKTKTNWKFPGLPKTKTRRVMRYFQLAPAPYFPSISSKVWLSRLARVSLWKRSMSTPLIHRAGLNSFKATISNAPYSQIGQSDEVTTSVNCGSCDQLIYSYWNRYNMLSEVQLCIMITTSHIWTLRLYVPYYHCNQIAVILIQSDHR